MEIGLNKYFNIKKLKPGCLIGYFDYQNNLHAVLIVLKILNSSSANILGGDGVSYIIDFKFPAYGGFYAKL